MIPTRRALGVLAVLAVLLLLGAGVYARIRGTASAEDTSLAASPELDSDNASSSVAIPVEGTPATRGTLVMSVTAAGQAEAWKRAVLTAQVGGRVAAVPVRESATVSAGQTLLALDPAEYDLAVEQERAAVQSADAQYRELTLFDDQIRDPQVRTEREQVARAKSGLEGARVRLRKAQLDQTRTRFPAPFAGRVADLKTVPGQWVRPGDELMTVVDTNPIKVEVQVLEGEVGYLAPGRAARVSFAAFPDEAFAGQVASINPVVEGETRTARVTVLVPNPTGRILPGMYARVAIDARQFTDRVLVPRSALLERDGRTMLFVYEDGRAKWRYVTPGLQNDSLVEIVPNPETDSVTPGETVLTSGQYTLIHDARVRLVRDAASAGGRPE